MRIDIPVQAADGRQQIGEEASKCSTVDQVDFLHRQLQSIFHVSGRKAIG